MRVCGHTTGIAAASAVVACAGCLFPRYEVAGGGTGGGASNGPGVGPGSTAAGPNNCTPTSKPLETSWTIDVGGADDDGVNAIDATMGLDGSLTVAIAADVTRPASFNGQFTLPGPAGMHDAAIGVASATGSMVTMKGSNAFGDGEEQNGLGVALSSFAGELLVGKAAGTVTFASSVVPSEGGDDVLLAAFDKDLVFQAGYLGGGLKNEKAVAAGYNGSSAQWVIAGTFTGPFALGPACGYDQAPPGGVGFFVAALDQVGLVCKWLNAYSGAGPATVTTLSIDSVVGKIAVAGTLSGMYSFGAVSRGGNGSYAFALVLDKGGAYQQDVAFGPSAEGLAVAVDPDHLAFGGQFEGTLSTSPPLESSGGKDAFVVSVTPEGKVMWTQRFGGPADDSINALAFDNRTDSIYATGAFRETACFGLDGVQSAGAQDGFLLRMVRQTGAIDFLRRFGGPSDDYGKAVVVYDNASMLDESRIVVAGRFSGSADFGSDPLTSQGGSDGFVVAVPRP